MNQTVVVAGINDFDPLGRKKIINLLNKLRIKKILSQIVLRLNGMRYLLKLFEIKEIILLS